MGTGKSYAAFVDEHLLVAGSLAAVLTKAKGWVDSQGGGSLLVFEDATGRQIDFDFGGTIEDVLSRALLPTPARRGRPGLGVQGREVSLLPQHWEWLRAQPAGTSATLRSLVEAEMNDASPPNAASRTRDATYQFITTMAGNRPGYEEACRALYRADRRLFNSETVNWPLPIKAHARRLAARWFKSKD